MPINILLAEDHGIVREGLRLLLHDEEEVNVVAEAANGKEALELLKKKHVNVILMDMNMPEMNGLECTKAVKEKFPEVNVLILSMYDHENYLLDVLDAGADGYLLKSSSKDELLFAINKVANGGVYISPEFTLNLLTRKRLEKSISTVAPAPKVTLSDREMDVLELIAQGLTNAEMADKLFISVRTIETRRKKLLEKTGTSNTATLIRYAILNGLIK